MNGSGHYLTAELLLAESNKEVANFDGTNPAATVLLAEAQVHATLALAAAQAEQVVADALSHPNFVNASQWEKSIQYTNPDERAPF